MHRRAMGMVLGAVLAVGGLMAACGDSVTDEPVPPSNSAPPVTPTVAPPPVASTADAGTEDAGVPEDADAGTVCEVDEDGDGRCELNCSCVSERCFTRELRACTCPDGDGDGVCESNEDRRGKKEDSGDENPKDESENPKVEEGDPELDG